MSDGKKVQCVSCNATIHLSTAEIYDGCCAPCFKRLNAKPPAIQQPQKRSVFGGMFEMLIPLLIFVLVFVGMPLGFKLVLGDKKTPIRKGTIKSISLVKQPNSESDIVGRSASIMSGFVVVEMPLGHQLWIPNENVAGIEFSEK